MVLFSSGSFVLCFLVDINCAAIGFNLKFCVFLKYCYKNKLKSQIDIRNRKLIYLQSTASYTVLINKPNVSLQHGTLSKLTYAKLYCKRNKLFIFKKKINGAETIFAVSLLKIINNVNIRLSITQRKKYSCFSPTNIQTFSCTWVLKIPKLKLNKPRKIKQ